MESLTHLIIWGRESFSSNISFFFLIYFACIFSMFHVDHIHLTTYLHFQDITNCMFSVLNYFMDTKCNLELEMVVLVHPSKGNLFLSPSNPNIGIMRNFYSLIAENFLYFPCPIPIKITLKYLLDVNIFIIIQMLK